MTSTFGNGARIISTPAEPKEERQRRESDENKRGVSRPRPSAYSPVRYLWRVLINQALSAP
jgi:hypothetical protein